MKISKFILAMWLAASAWAQVPAPKQQAKPSGGRVVMASPKAPAPADGNKKASAAAPRNVRRKPSAKPAVRSSVRWHRRRHGAVEHLSGAKMAESGKPARKGERDPFVSPIVERIRNAAHCTGSGRQCLFVDDINLQGVVSYPGGYIAVVSSGNHTYFLHDNDPLADGDVQRITKDSITLSQRSSDILGRPVVHEVTRKLGAV